MGFFCKFPNSFRRSNHRNRSQNSHPEFESWNNLQVCSRHQEICNHFGWYFHKSRLGAPKLREFETGSCWNQRFWSLEWFHEKNVKVWNPEWICKQFDGNFELIPYLDVFFVKITQFHGKSLVSTWICFKSRNFNLWFMEISKDSWWRLQFAIVPRLILLKTVLGLILMIALTKEGLTDWEHFWIFISIFLKELTLYSIYSRWKWSCWNTC